MIQKIEEPVVKDKVEEEENFRAETEVEHILIG